jgi:hypothetical protein
MSRACCRTGCALVSQSVREKGKGDKGKGATHEAGKRPPGHQEMHADVCVAQVVAKVLCEGFDGGFGRVVGCVPRRVRDALLAACYDDGRGGRVAGSGTGLERGDVGVQAVYHAVEVCLEDLSGR